MCPFEGRGMRMEAKASNGLVMVERIQVRLRAQTGHGGEKVV